MFNRLEWQRQWRKKNPDKIRKYNETAYKSRGDKIRESKRNYYRKNKDKKIKNQKRYYTAHKEEILSKNKKYTQKHPEKFVIYKKRYKLRKRYGISLEEFNAILMFQNNKCKICEKEFTKSKDKHIDHDHTTGLVRGLLCPVCNKMLGYSMDKIDILKKAILYLESSELHEQSVQNLSVPSLDEN